jgi:hypothetical protein
MAAEPAPRRQAQQHLGRRGSRCNADVRMARRIEMRRLHLAARGLKTSAPCERLNFGRRDGASIARATMALLIMALNHRELISLRVLDQFRKSCMQLRAVAD